MSYVFDMERRLELLGPGFGLLSELTGQTKQRKTLEYYAEQWELARVSVDSVLWAIEQTCKSWNRPYWPTVEQIAKLALEHQWQSGAHRVNLDAWFEECAANRWDRLRRRAQAWREANPERFTEGARLINHEVKTLIVSGQHPTMAQSEAYRKAFKTGARVGYCLRQETADWIAYQKALASQLQEQARAKQAEDDHGPESLGDFIERLDHVA